ncbi:hypothetical protein POTOM_032817 [Populus tomentosa]|uniref:Uncharacterized protein n=1 Tax=Populus tomentosa TaxID=118781 RepID=A0A8X8CQ47_POPTO|nr:hypothetical protein POTOM_032817 [Populus tomentosa]
MTRNFYRHNSDFGLPGPPGIEIYKGTFLMLNRVMSLTGKLYCKPPIKLQWRGCHAEKMAIFIIFLASGELLEPVSYFQGAISI